MVIQTIACGLCGEKYVIDGRPEWIAVYEGSNYNQELQTTWNHP